MTNTQRRTYSRQYQNLVKGYESRYVKPIWKALISSFTGQLRSNGPEAARGQLSLVLFNENLYPVIRKLYEDAGLTAARKVRSELRLEQHKRFGTNQELIDKIIDYLQKFILDRSIRPISQTTRDWLLKLLEKGISEGKGAAEIAKDIENDEFLKYQAIRIVRTETVRATNVGAMQAANTSPFVVVKEWIAAHDNRTRHSHRRIDGTVAEIEETFSNGLLQPGDPKGEAEEVINCRCTVAIVAKRDENGRLIRKPTNQFAFV